MESKLGQEEFGKREWEAGAKVEVQRLLEAKLPGEHISTRPGAGGCTCLRVWGKRREGREKKRW